MVAEAVVIDMKNQLKTIRINADEVQIEEFKSQFKLPLEAIFQGYVICNAFEEFVHLYDDSPSCTRIAWTKEPELAKVFEHADGAFKVALRIGNLGKHKTDVWGLFETEEQIFTWKIAPSGVTKS